MAKKSATPRIRKKISKKSVIKTETTKLHKRLPSAWSLTKKSIGLLWENRILFFGIAAVYALLTFIFVGIASSSDVNSLKASFGSNFSIGNAFNVFVNLLGTNSDSSNVAAGVYQFILSIIVSLAIIWAYRQVVAGSRIRIRDSFYQGMYALVPFVFILLVIGLELLPLLIGSVIYSLVIGNGIAVVMFEKILWGLMFGASALTSLYLLSSSIFALYIVTLPDMTPFKALRSAHSIVKGRRILLIRKILFLPLLLFILATVIMLPFIIWMTALTHMVFFLISMSVLLVVHGYFFTLYRELINE